MRLCALTPVIKKAGFPAFFTAHHTFASKPVSDLRCIFVKSPGA